MEPIARNIIQTLESQNLISRTDIVNGSTVFLMGRQRNRFFVFKQLHGPSFFIKQAHEGEAGTFESVTTEAKIYQAVATKPAFAHLCAAMPRLLHFDPTTASMTLELITDAEDLGTKSRRVGQITPVQAAQMGVIAAGYHDIPHPEIADLGIAFEENPHWIFRLNEEPSPLPSLKGRSKASAEIIDMIMGQPDLGKCLERSKKDWNPRCLIHADFKWENFLCVSPAKDSKDETLKILDWERADIGDPAWDVGCGLAAFVIHRAMKAPIVDAETFDMHQSFTEMRAFWAGYINARNMTGQDLETFCVKSIDMMAARLLVAAYEHCYGVDHAPPLAITLVQLAKLLSGAQAYDVFGKMLLRPDRCAA
ncbi:phosphotransferase [Yoonia maritima]|uniref:phosphotransferase n=1 Tax=Yoonia maritima TaxID=1435347 RepID=UPI000D0FC92A|nr:phosphotransferase [Yoonia maritima]